MYITILDLVAVIIALVVSVTLVITTAIKNAQLSSNVRYWRDAYYLSIRKAGK